ncbi:MAG: RDD family protein, partial [Bhargavaea sp.]
MNAGFFLRLKAFLFDYLLILAYMLVLAVFSMFIIPSIQQLFTGSPASAQLAGFLMITLPVSLYFTLADSRIGGGSFGKRITGIRVMDLDGRPLSVLHSAVRTALKFVPW